MSETVIRRAASGIASGLIAGAIENALRSAVTGAPGGIAIGAFPEGWPVHLFLAAGLGFTFALLFQPETAGYAESTMGGMAYGVFWWLLVSLTATPLVSGRLPSWQAGPATEAFPALIGMVMQGALAGLGCRLLLAVLDRLLGEPAPRPPTAIVRRVVVLGGGFAGVTVTRKLERLFARNTGVHITLISNVNHMLFTPMLTEVATSMIEPRHIAPTLRSFFTSVDIIRGDVRSIDMVERVVRVSLNEEGETSQVPFDHLVLALGAVPNFYDLPGIEENAFTFKSLEAAIELRNHVIGMLELADEEPDPAKRRILLTFVVAGGGFAGSELVGALNDFVRSSVFYYPRVEPADVAVILVHSSRRILPELSDELAAYALEKLEARGVICKCGARVAGAEPDKILLSGGEQIEAGTLVWTAGNTPHPLMKQIDGATIKHGAIETDATFAVLGVRDVWALGDCAWIPDAKTGRPQPATAQHALAEAPALARNVHAALHGRTLRPFRYRSFGSMALLGHRIGAAEVRGLRFSGLLAWIMWRMVYLYRLPTLERKLRVSLDWIVDMFFPRDIVQTAPAAGPHPRKGTDAPVTERVRPGEADLS